MICITGRLLDGGGGAGRPYQRVTTFKNNFTIRSHAVWDGNRGQRGATRKNIHPNRSHAVRDNNRGQRCAT